MSNQNPEIKELEQPVRSLNIKYSADGTNYQITAHLYTQGYTNGYICISEPALLIVAGYEKTAYAFLLKSYISYDYVFEKLCRNGSTTDAKNLTLMIHAAQTTFQGGNY